MKRIFFTLYLLLTFFYVNAQLLYKVTGNGHEKSSYIFGTHHLAPLSILDSIPYFNDAFNSTDLIVGEIDMSDGLQNISQAILPYLFAPQGERLSDLINPDTLDIADKAFFEITGYKLQSLDMLKPMGISAIITQTVVSKQFPEFQPELQLDYYLQKKGKEAGKKIIGLETAKEQAEILYNYTPIKDQANSLIKTLLSPENIIKDLKKLNDAYFHQDINKLLELSQSDDDSDKAFMEALLNKRNDSWIKKIPTIMCESPAFIVVGALHLAGDKGILNQLKEQGFQIQGIK